MDEKLAFNVASAKYAALGLKAAAEAAGSQLAQLEKLLAAESRGEGDLDDQAAKVLLSVASDHLNEAADRLPDATTYVTRAQFLA